MNAIITKTNRIKYLLIIVVLFITSCEEEFEPLKERETHPFSIYGYLDSPAELNWVRVSEVTDKLYIDENATIDAVVTLEHLESGQSEVMQDTLVEYETDVYAFNFSATMLLEPEQSYLLTAERSDGQQSRVTVTMPSAFPDPDLNISEGTLNLEIEDVEHLAAVDIFYEVRNENTDEILKFRYHYLHHASEEFDSPENYKVEGVMTQWTHCNDINFFFSSFEYQYTILSSWIYVASAGPDYLYFPSIEEWKIELPDFGNVENGAGYVVGVVSKEIPVPGAADFCENYLEEENI